MSPASWIIRYLDPLAQLASLPCRSCFFRNPVTYVQLNWSATSLRHRMCVCRCQNQRGHKVFVHACSRLPADLLKFQVFPAPQETRLFSGQADKHLSHSRCKDGWLSNYASVWVPRNTKASCGINLTGLLYAFDYSDKQKWGRNCKDFSVHVLHVLDNYVCRYVCTYIHIYRRTCICIYIFVYACLRDIFMASLSCKSSDEVLT